MAWCAKPAPATLRTRCNAGQTCSTFALSKIRLPLRQNIFLHPETIISVLMAPKLALSQCGDLHRDFPPAGGPQPVCDKDIEAHRSLFLAGDPAKVHSADDVIITLSVPGRSHNGSNLRQIRIHLQRSISSIASFVQKNAEFVLNT